MTILYSSLPSLPHTIQKKPLESRHTVNKYLSTTLRCGETRFPNTAFQFGEKMLFFSLRLMVGVYCLRLGSNIATTRLHIFIYAFLSHETRRQSCRLYMASMSMSRDHSYNKRGSKISYKLGEDEWNDMVYKSTSEC